MSVNGPISPKQCYYEMDYSLYSFYWLDSLEIRLDHNSTYYRSLSKNSDVKPRVSHCDYQNLQYKTHPEFWPSHRRIFKTSLYYKTRLILETRRYFFLVHWKKAGPEAGGTKALFVNFSFSIIFDLAKVSVKLFKSHSYLTGVPAAELRRHLSNINMIFNSVYLPCSQSWKIRKIMELRKLV